MHRVKFAFMAVALLTMALFAFLYFYSGKTEDYEDRGKRIEAAYRAQILAESKRKTIVTDKSLQSPRKHSSRRLKATSQEAQETVKRLISKLDGTDDYQSSLALFEAQRLQSEDLLDFVQKALDLPGDKPIRKEAFDLLLGYSDPSLLPLVKQAFAGQNLDLKRSALEALENIGSGAQKPDENTENPESGFEGDDLADLLEPDNPENQADQELSEADRENILAMLAEAFNDVDAEVRQQAMKSLLQMELGIQVEGFKLAQESSFDDVRSSVVFITGTSANWDTMQLAINALGDPNPMVARTAKENLDFYVRKAFDSPEQAKDWWQQNKFLFDDYLFLEDLENLTLIFDQNLQ